MLRLWSNRCWSFVFEWIVTKRETLRETLILNEASLCCSYLSASTYTYKKISIPAQVIYLDSFRAETHDYSSYQLISQLFFWLIDYLFGLWSSDICFSAFPKMQMCAQSQTETYLMYNNIKHRRSFSLMNNKNVDYQKICWDIYNELVNHF